MKIAKHCIVTGRVQGVYFRQGTLEQARMLDVKGWVRNLPSGQVECMLCGDAKMLDQLCEWLKRGPPAAKVDELQINDLPWQEFQEFTILR